MKIICLPIVFGKKYFSSKTPTDVRNLHILHLTSAKKNASCEKIGHEISPNKLFKISTQSLFCTDLFLQLNFVGNAISKQSHLQFRKGK